MLHKPPVHQHRLYQRAFSLPYFNQIQLKINWTFSSVYTFFIVRMILKGSWNFINYHQDYNHLFHLMYYRMWGRTGERGCTKRMNERTNEHTNGVNGLGKTFQVHYTLWKLKWKFIIIIFIAIARMRMLRKSEKKRRTNKFNIVITFPPLNPLNNEQNIPNPAASKRIVNTQYWL